jgi:hypothetical protein
MARSSTAASRQAGVSHARLPREASRPTTSADVIFEQPPASVPTKYGGATREVLTGLGGESPDYITQVADNPTTAHSVIAAHVRWDSSEARFTGLWIAAAASLPNRDELLHARIQDQPADIYNMRLDQDFATPAVHAAV